MGCSEVLGDIGSIFYMRVAHKILFGGKTSVPLIQTKT